MVINFLLAAIILIEFLSIFIHYRVFVDRELRCHSAKANHQRLNSSCEFFGNVRVRRSVESIHRFVTPIKLSVNVQLTTNK